MKNKKKRKGFTLVELLVVIAILAVLATVAILGYTQFTKKANIANDQAICSQMNLALQSNEALDNKARYAHQAVGQCQDAGFILENLTPSTANYHFAYDQANNRFMLLETDFSFNYGDTKHSNVSNGSPERVHVFVVVGNQKEFDESKENGFSAYLRKEFDETVTTLTTNKGIDVGECTTVTSITYNNANSEEGQDVVIRTNGGALEVIAPLDTIKHYGTASNVRIEAVSTSSFYEYGNTSLVEIKSGRFVITNSESANVAALYLTATGNNYSENLILATMDGAKLPAVVYRDEVTAPTTGKKLVVTIQENVDEEGNNPAAEEKIYIYGVNDVEKGTGTDDNEGTYENVTPLGQMILEAPTGSTKTNSVKYIVSDSNPSKAVASEKKEALLNDIKDEVIKVTFKGNVTITTLSKFSEDWNTGKYFEIGTPATVELLTNIDLTKKDYWGPIGCWEYPFFGTFDGHGFTISNLSNHKTMEGENYQHVYTDNTTIGFGETYGFFGIVGGGDTVIKNVKFTNVDIDIQNGKNVGTLIGYVPNTNDFGTSGKGGAYWYKLVEGKKCKYDKQWIENTSVTNLMKELPEHFGADDLTVTNVIMENGTLSAAGHVGGLVGKIYSTGTATFDGCTNNLVITIDGTGGLAGIVGYCNGNEAIIVKNCKNLEDTKLIFDPSSSSSGVMLSDFAYITNPSKLTCDDTNINQATVVLPTENTKKNISQFTYSGKAPITLEGYTIGTVNSVSALTLKNCKVTGKTTNNGNMTIEGCTIDYLNNQGIITIESGTFCTKSTLSDGNTTCLVKNSGTMTINSGTFNEKVNNEANATLTVNNGTFNGDVTNSGTATIDEGKFNGIVTNKAGATLTISGGTFDNTNNKYVANYGQLSITGGTVGSLTNMEGTTEITGGTINWLRNSTSAGATLIVKGGKFGVNPSDYVADGYISKLQNGVYIIKQGEWTAEYNGNKYETLQEAVTAFSGSSYQIKLLKNVVETSKTITCSKALVFDLNGHNLDCAITTNGNYVNFYGSGTATLKSGTNISKVYVSDQANVVIEDGVIINRPGGNAAVQIQNYDNTNKKWKNETRTGIITIKGGTITGKIQCDSSTIKITGGTFNGDLIVEKEASLVIEGGTFTSDPTPYLAEGYKAEKQSGKWVVSKNN